MNVLICLFIMVVGIGCFIWGLYTTNGYTKGQFIIMGVALTLTGLLGIISRNSTVSTATIKVAVDTIPKKDTPVILTPDQIKKILPGNS
jgi:hypothetical protein